MSDFDVFIWLLTLAGLALGALGYCIHHSVRHAPSADGPQHVGPWLALGVAILWTHPLLDVLYCGWGRDADWPVGLFWPFLSVGVARPWMPWNAS